MQWAGGFSRLATPRMGPDFTGAFQMLSRLVAGALLSLVAGAAWAESVTTVCTLQVGRQQAWVPTQVVIRREKDSDTVLVNDPIILQFVRRPVVGRVKTETATRITFAWELKNIQNDAGQRVPNFLYRATVQKATGVVKITAIPSGYPTTFSASGHCDVK